MARNDWGRGRLIEERGWRGLGKVCRRIKMGVELSNRHGARNDVIGLRLRRENVARDDNVL